MSQEERDTYDESAANRILTSKVPPSAQFSEADRTAMLRHQKALVDKVWTLEERAPIQRLHFDPHLMELIQDETDLKKVLSSRGSATTQQNPTLAKTTVDSIIPELVFGCNTSVFTPPFTTGTPLQERVGEKAQAPPSLGDLRTYSELALPNEGQLSLGVALGNWRDRTLHPPAEEGPLSFIFKWWDENNAQASLGQFFAVPGAPLASDRRVTVTADMVIGGSSQPFYVMEREGIIYLMASTFLTVFAPGSQTDPVTVQFLYDTSLSAQPLTLMRNFSVSQTLTTAKGATWLFIGLEVRMRVLRNFALPNPPLEQRKGFGLIDLRAPGQSAHRIHPLLAEAGPIRVPRIGVSVCLPDPKIFTVP